MKPQLTVKQFALSLLLASSFAAANTFVASNANCSTDAFAFAQGPGRGPITVPRDAEAERQSYKSLDAAKFYYYKRKPDKNDKSALERSNKAILDRLQEIIDTNPNFARIDEVHFLLGEVYNRSGEPDKAIEFWKKAIEETSDEKMKAEAQKHMDEAQAKNKSKKG